MTRIKSIEPLKLSALMAADNNTIIIVDVREPIEYQIERIKGTVNIPLAKIAVDIYSLPLNNVKQMIILCQAGVRSLVACEKLNNEGLDIEIINLNGGINNWKTFGLETVKTSDLK